ncbi:IGS10 protein, partial [Hippolais icterina]|nr:IGS10 protein [Hippolais icterina]
EDGRILVLASGALALRAADVFDTGLYHCISTNQQDADVLTFRVTVVDPQVEPSGVNGARLRAALGSTLHLPCTATAAPDAALTWVTPEHTVLRQSAGNKHILANGTLRIQGLTERDVGYFRCVAANRYGADLLVSQVLLRQGEAALKKKHGALGEWEEGSGSELLRSAAAQTQPPAPPATLGARGEPAAPAAGSQGAQGARHRNSHGKMPPWPYGDRAGRRFRAHRRQFVSSGRRADPQRWAALLEKTKRNLTVTDKRGEVATEPPIHVHKLSEVPEDEEETSGDLISPEEEFMIPVTERSPVPALGAATELRITAGPEETTNPTPAWSTEPLTAPPSPPPHSVAPASKRLQTLPNPTDSWQRSDPSQISANGVKQSAVSSGTSTLFPAGQKSVYSGESDNQHLKSVSVTPMTETTGTSKAVTPQNTADKLYILTEPIDIVSTKTDHQVPVATVNAPSSEFGPIYFHSTQKGGTPNPPLASNFSTHQQIRVIQDVPTHPPQLQQHYGRRRKISGRRRVVRPGHSTSMKEHRYSFGRPGSARGSTAVATGVQLDRNYISNIPTLNNSLINPCSPEAAQPSPSTMSMPLEHPVGTHPNTAFLREEQQKHSAGQKAAATVMSVTARDTATAAASALGVTGSKPTAALVNTPQTDTRATKSKTPRVGGRRGQRRKRPPKTPAPQRVAAARSTAGTPAASTSVASTATPAARSTAATDAARSTAAIPAASTATLVASTATPAASAATPAARSTAATPAARITAATPAARSTAASTATPAASTATPAASPAASTATPTGTALTPPAVPPSPAPAKPLPRSMGAVSRPKAALGVPGSPGAAQHSPLAATPTSATPGTWRSTQPATALPGSVAAQSPPVALQTTPGTPGNTPLATSAAASPAQTPTTGLRASPWLDQPPGAAGSATPGPAPAQPVTATARAGEQPRQDLREGAVQEHRAAQPTLPARAVPSPPAPGTRHPSPRPAPAAAVP